MHLYSSLVVIAIHSTTYYTVCIPHFVAVVALELYSFVELVLFYLSHTSIVATHTFGVSQRF